ncbi:MAG: helix-turn-helix transcriptional regulator, partial [Pseudomonadota bacterium]
MRNFTPHASTFGMVIHAAAESTADAHPPASLGADIRALRRARGVTLEALGSQIGRSVGWLSQVERDLSTPAMDDIEAIASALGVSRSFLFGAGAPRPGEEGRIVRAGAGRSLGSSDGEAGRGTVGLVERLLSPDLSDEFEVIHSVFRPGSRRKTRVARPTTEL